MVMLSRAFTIYVPVCNGCDPLGASSIGTDNTGILPFRYVLFDPLEHSWLCIEIVDGNVEKALDLRGMQVHGDYVVCPCDREHIRHQLGTDRSSGFVLLVLPRIPIKLEMCAVIHCSLNKEDVYERRLTGSMG